MSIESLVSSFLAQVSIVWKAPAPFLMVLVAVSVLIWRAMEWLYQGRLQNLTDKVARRDDEIAQHQTLTPLSSRDVAWSVGQTVAATASAADKRGADAIERHKALNAMYYAAEAAAEAPRARSGRAMDAASQQVYAALLTAQKTFNLPMPPQDDRTNIRLEVGRRFLEHVRPLLKAGHDDEARSSAYDFIKRFTDVVTEEKE